MVGDDELFHQMVNRRIGFSDGVLRCCQRKALGNLISYDLFWSCSLGFREGLGMEEYIFLNKNLGSLMPI